MNLHRIRVTLTAWYVTTLFLIVLVTGVTVFLVYTRALHNEVDDSLRSGASSLAGQLQEGVGGFHAGASGGPEDEDDVGDSDVLRYLSGGSGDTFYVVLAPDGQSALNPLNVQLSDFPDDGAVAEAIADGSAWRTVSTDSGPYRLYFLSVRNESQTAAIVEVGRSLEERNEHARSLGLFLIGAGGIGLLLAAAGGLYLSGRALQPVHTAFQRQRAFVADASHELRSPLTLLRASAEALQRSRGSKLADVDQLAVGDILTESDRIARLVEDLLTLARLDEDRLLLQAEPIEIPEVLRDAERWAGAAARQGVSFEVICPSSLEAFADREQTLRVLRILLDNAIHYTPEGGRVTLRAEREDDEVVLSVQDTGAGISEEAQLRIFDRFYRVDAARTRDETSGTGLGLAIAKGIIEAQGGKIAVESAPGEGATFTFSLPAPPTER
jgi:signal transduction histidine kinase